MSDKPAGTKASGAGSPWAPLRCRAFRAMWSMWLLSNLSMWMGNVASAWMMALLAEPAIWVALVHACTTLPVLLLALPMGALADVADRRRLMLFTQVWLGTVALLQAGLALVGGLSAPMLLVMTFAYGCGLAMRLPAFAATVPELVQRQHLPAALALNAVSMNASRIIGPLVTGIMLTMMGAASVFLAVAVMTMVSIGLIACWHRPDAPAASRPLANESLLQSLRGGVRFVLRSYSLKSVLLRISIYFLSASALPALLPLVARGVHPDGAVMFTVLLSAMGAGAVSSIFVLQHLRARVARDTLALLGAVTQGCAMIVIALTRSPFVAAIAMFVSGVSWLATSNPLTVAAQLSLPDWVRARGMSIHQMAMMGSTALGAAFWGQIATLLDVRSALVGAALTGIVGMIFANRAMPERGAELGEVGL